MQRPMSDGSLFLSASLLFYGVAHLLELSYQIPPRTGTTDVNLVSIEVMNLVIV